MAILGFLGAGTFCRRGGGGGRGDYCMKRFKDDCSEENLRSVLCYKISLFTFHNRGCRVGPSIVL